MILPALYTWFTGIDSINTSVGGRIFPIAADLGAARPHIEMRVLNTQGHTHLEGNSRIYKSMVTIEVASTSIAEADSIAMACLESGIVEHKGLIGDSVTVHGVDIDEGLIQYDDGVEPGSDIHVFVSSFTLDIFWSTEN